MVTAMVNGNGKWQMVNGPMPKGVTPASRAMDHWIAVGRADQQVADHLDRCACPRGEAVPQRALRWKHRLH
jgi:hypothetical protein